jgi:PAS domain S-box-containing protein
VLPFLIWVAMRCRPVFAAGAALIVGLEVIGSTTLNVGYFDSGKPLADRILSAQTFVLVEAILVVLLAAVFAERRRASAVLEDSKASLADALAAGQVMAFEWNAATLQSRRSDNASQILGNEQVGGARLPCNEFLRRVHPEDRRRLKMSIHCLRPSEPSYALTFRFVRPDDQQVWLEETAKGEFDATGRLLRIKGLTRDISDRKRAELALAERTMQLDLAGKAALVGSFAYDVDTERVQISEGYAAIHGFPEGTTEVPLSKWRAGVHPDDRDDVEVARRRALRQRRGEYKVEYRIVRRGDVRWIEARKFISYNGDGHPQRVIGVNIDVTERKRVEEQHRVLVGELDHRVKNVLATVSAVVSHTLDASSSMADFATALNGRVQSMARTHELLSASRWQGISVAELVRRELAPYATTHNTEIKGPEVLLSRDGQVVAMVLHELATNAAKYGALSTHNGRVLIQWGQRPNGNPHSHLMLEWREVGGPLVITPENPGFGTHTIRDLIPYEFSGAVDLAFAPNGVQCRLELQADWLINHGEPVSQAVAHASLRTGDAACMASHLFDDALPIDDLPWSELR